MNDIVKKYSLAGAALFVIATATAAHAQDSASPSGADQNDESADTGEIVLRSSEIVVTGRRGKYISSGGLGARSVLDTPFSVTAVSEQEINDRLADTVDDILKGDPAARTASNAVVSIIPEVTVRGLLLDQLNSYKIDGMAFPNRTSLPIEHFQQVELLKGLSGFMYGFGTPGGIVNYISKRPTNDPQLTLGAGYTSDGVWKGSVDAGSRFGPNDELGLRVVGVNQQGNTYIDDAGHLTRRSISGSFDWNLNDTFTLLADGIYQDRKSEGVIFAVYIPDTDIPVLDPINGRTNLSETGSFFNNELFIGTVGLDVNIGPSWKANVSYRRADMNAWWREGNANVINTDGDFTFQEYTGTQKHTYDQVQGIVIGQFDTGPLTHDVTLGVSWQKLKQFNDLAFGSFNLAETSNLYNPVEIVGSFDDPYTRSRYLRVSIEQKAGFVSDTITWGSVSLLAGLRLNEFEQFNYDTSGATTDSYKTTPLTPTVALRYKPRSDMTFYASYVQALEKGGQASVLNANYGDVFGPLKSKQYELGFKADTATWAASAAVFRINREAEYTNASNIYVQDGLSRYQGIEASVTARQLTGLELTASGMYLDAKLKEASANAGNAIPGAPKWQGGLQASYAPDQIEGLKLIAGLNYLGETYLEIGNIRKVPDYVTVDASVRYTLDMAMPLTLTAAMKNIGGKDYWTVRNSGTPALQAGSPRTVALGASIVF